jgi:hypothetical protein
MKPVTTGIVAALLTLSPAALANDVNPDLIDLSGLTAAAMLVKTSNDYEWKNILIVVDNKSAAKFDTTRWSCGILSKLQLIHEEPILVDNVRPNSYAIKSQRLGYESGPVDGVQCRLVNVQIGPTLISLDK